MASGLRFEHQIEGAFGGEAHVSIAAFGEYGAEFGLSRQGPEDEAHFLAEGRGCSDRGGAPLRRRARSVRWAARGRAFARFLLCDPRLSSIVAN